MPISAEERYPKQKIRVLEHTMAYVETGRGDPVVFLHGNPTSSYLWRNIIPHAEELGRCVAPDLIGMGDSQKLADSGPDRYGFVEHARFLDALLDQLDITQNVILVVHDWGSALGFHWAERHRDRIKGIAYMEAIVAPLTWEDWPPPVKPVFQRFRSPAGESMILENNAFVEQVLPGAVIREMSDTEMEVYRRPFTEAGESRRPTLSWPRQIPIEGEPADVTEIVKGYGQWLAESPIPKLFINAQPGAILRGPQRDFCRRWPNQVEVEVAGSHFIQEDSPDDIGTALASWIRDLA